MTRRRPECSHQKRCPAKNEAIPMRFPLLQWAHCLTRRWMVCGVTAFALHAMCGCATASPDAEGGGTGAVSERPNGEETAALIVEGPVPVPQLPVDAVMGEVPYVFKGDDPEQLTVVTFGSSSCPNRPIVYVPSMPEDTLLILTASAGEPCTADMAAYATVVEVPDRYEGFQSVVINETTAEVVSAR